MRFLQSMLRGQRGRTLRSPGAEAYPALDALLGAYFHQDFDLSGTTLVEIIAEYRRCSWPADVARARVDLLAFMDACGPDDRRLAERFEFLFRPEVIVEGWEGLTTRAWLERLAELLA